MEPPQAEFASDPQGDFIKAFRSTCGKQLTLDAEDKLLDIYRRTVEFALTHGAVWKGSCKEFALGRVREIGRDTQRNSTGVKVAKEELGDAADGVIEYWRTRCYEYELACPSPQKGFFCQGY